MVCSFHVERPNSFLGYPHPYYAVDGISQVYSFHTGGVMSAFVDVNTRVDSSYLTCVEKILTNPGTF